MTEILSETHCFRNKKTFTWKIHDISRICQYFKKQRICSEDYLLDNVTYRLEAHMSADSGFWYRYWESDSERFFNIELIVGDCPEQQQANVDSTQKVIYRVMVVNKDGKCETKQSQIYLIGRPEAKPSSVTNVICIPASALIRNKDNIIVDDALTILLELTPQCFSHRIIDLKQEADACSHLENLSKSMAKLLEKPSTADIVIRVEGEDIAAHSVILVARSPVFKAMLTSENKEEHDKVIEINDISKSAMQIFLKHLYTGKLTEPTNIPTDLLMDVYEAADNYKVQKLRDFCAEILLERLSEENMEKYVSIASRHNDKKILDFVADFISRREEIFQGEKFNLLAKNEPEFGLRVLTEVLIGQKME